MKEIDFLQLHCRNYGYAGSQQKIKRLNVWTSHWEDIEAF